MLPVSDSVALSAAVDGVFVVAQAGRVTDADIVETLDRLDKVSAPGARARAQPGEPEHEGRLRVRRLSRRHRRNAAMTSGDRRHRRRMTDGTQFVRRNRVDERVALAIGAVAGIVAATAGARPTGSAAIDAVLVALSVAAVVWASASAPWWAPTLAAGVAAVVAFDPLLAVVGAVGILRSGSPSGCGGRTRANCVPIVAAIALNVLIRSELDGFLGLSAIIGISMSVMLFVVGLQRRPSTIRRTGWIVAGTFGALAVLALVALGGGCGGTFDRTSRPARGRPSKPSTR